MLELRLLGSPHVLLDGNPLGSLPAKAAEALLYYLACSPGPQPRQLLAELLWHDRTSKQALANLRTVVTHLRRAVDSYIIADRQTLTFNRSLDFQLDTEQFETRPDSIRGDFLSGFHLPEGRGFEEWLAVERERLNIETLAVLRSSAQALQSNGDYAAACRFAQQAVAQDPLDEGVLRLVMDLLVRTGRRSAALQAYESLKTALSEDLGVEPVWETEALYLKVRKLDVPPTIKIPTPAWPLVGRQSELNSLNDLLKSPNPRLITITGSGGVGKTRLLIELLTRLKMEQPGRFLDGIQFVPLISLAAAAEAPAWIANSIGLQLNSELGAETAISEYLRGKEMLLALDNAEHLLAGREGAVFSRFIDRLVQDCPQLALVISSRSRFNLGRELVVPLNGLPNSNSDEPAALFVQAARRVLPEFAPNANERQDITRIGARVDGNPLALELAGGSIRHRSCAEILELLTTRPERLQSVQSDAPARHTSLEAVFQHSWQLLGPETQHMLSAAAVFQGQFDGQACAALIARDPHTEITALLDASLLTVLGPGRFVMHALIRSFAAARLAEHTAQKQAVEKRHAYYFADVLAAEQERLGSERQPEALDHLSERISDIHTAWNWGINNHDFDLLTHMLPAYFEYLLIRGDLELAGKRMDAATEGLDGQHGAEADYLASRIATRAAALRHALGSSMPNVAVIEHSLAIARQEQDHEEVVFCLLTLSEMARTHADTKKGIHYASEALELSRRLESGLQIAQAQLSLGYLHAQTPASARPFFEASLATFKATQNPYGIAKALTGMGGVYEFQGSYESALAAYQESHELAERLKNKGGALAAMNQVATCLANLGRQEEAWALFEEELGLAQSIGSQTRIGTALTNLGWLSEHHHKYERALHYYQQSLQIFLAMGEVWQVPFVRSNIGAALINLERWEEADEQLRAAEAQGLRDLDRNRGLLSNIYRAMGELSHKRGRDSQAVDYFVKAAEISEIVQLQLLALTELAVFYAERAQAAAALALANLILAQPNASSLESVRAEQIQLEVRQQVSKSVAQVLASWGAETSIAAAIQAAADGRLPRGNK
jgi:DNA-binding SARP family transcriptional activator/predicted ATPase